MAEPYSPTARTRVTREPERAVVASVTSRVRRRWPSTHPSEVS